jgi:1,4-dihydroxy-2-naphthoate octaprenyltransferase
MQNADAIQKKRLTTMFAIDLVCFVLAGAAVIGYVAAGIGWLAPVFIGAIVIGLGAQIWFILGWMKAAKQDEEGRPS